MIVERESEVEDTNIFNNKSIKYLKHNLQYNKIYHKIDFIQSK